MKQGLKTQTFLGLRSAPPVTVIGGATCQYLMAEDLRTGSQGRTGRTWVREPGLEEGGGRRGGGCWRDLAWQTRVGRPGSGTVGPLTWIKIAYYFTRWLTSEDTQAPLSLETTPSVLSLRLGNRCCCFSKVQIRLIVKQIVVTSQT